jgi:acyl carrier protein
MLPAALVFLERMPLTPNGKLDRRALPEPGSGPERTAAEFRGPRSRTECALARIWSEVLDQDPIDVRDSFFDLGGHSLRAVQVVARVRQTLGLPLDIQLLFRAPTIEQLAAAIDAMAPGREGEVSAPIQPVPREGDLPLSFAQQRLWFLDKLAEGGVAYNVPAAIRLEGELDVAALERAFGEVVRRHEVLRTTFPEVGGQPVQRIHPVLEVRLSVTDLRHLPAEAREAEARRHANAELRTAFDLARGPLFRAGLLRLDAQDHVVLFTMHHVVADGWSGEILIREIAALYEAFAANGPSPLPEPVLQYADYAVWQRRWLTGGVLESELGYWKRSLGRDLPVLQLATDRPRAEEPLFDGARHSFAVDREVSARLDALSRQEGATLFMTLLAAFKALLYRDTGQDDIVIGTAAGGRSRPEVEGLIGFFINMLALRTDLSGNPTFRELLARVREVTLGAFAHQDVPFEKVVETLQPTRTGYSAPLFQVAFGLQNAPARGVDVRGLTLRPFGAEHEDVRYDLTVWMSDGPEGLRGTWTYNTRLFDQRTVVGMQERFATVLREVALRPDARLDDLQTRSVVELRRRREQDRARLLTAKAVAVRAGEGGDVAP